MYIYLFIFLAVYIRTLSWRSFKLYQGVLRTWAAATGKKCNMWPFYITCISVFIDDDDDDNGLYLMRVNKC